MAQLRRSRPERYEADGVWAARVLRRNEAEAGP